MKNIFKLLIAFICLTSYSQESESNDFNTQLNSKSDNLTFTFIGNFSNYFIVLEKEPNGDEHCSKIDSNDTQKIIDLFNEFTLLNNNYTFFEMHADSEKNQKLAKSRKLMIQVKMDNSNLFIMIPTLELAQELLNRIGTELNYEDCFIKLSNEIKK